MTPVPQEGQPLYVPPAERVSIDEIKHRAEEIQDLAVTESKRLVSEVYEQNMTRAALVAVGVVLVAASVAYLLGRATARRVVVPDVPPL